ncbi:hypothetical protein MNBD_ALPHA12-886 [hydrothermal vent metagenome]|uniref:Cytochrome c domain-containing protein n=1 Tax=hydrothermal vent metagenome TaxID=652676 RepID=A0A3B0TZ86_9ZZZZ
MRKLMLFGAAFVLLATAAVMAGPREDILAQLTAQAKADNAAFAGFSADRGYKLFSTKWGLGKPATPSCTACHTASPLNEGKTRAGKQIAPMAISKTPDRFTDPEKVAKWFRRNCRTVLGRECTALEKGDYLTFMISK